MQTKPRISFNLIGRRRLGGHYSGRADGPLTREELDVAEALRDYNTTGATEFDCVSVAALWQVYVRWWARHRRDWIFPLSDGQYPRLTVRQFGRAVRRVFPGVRRVHRRQRRVGLIGPTFQLTYVYRGIRKREAIPINSLMRLS